jgi:hypothetical protein
MADASMVELRFYHVKPGHREAFLEFFRRQGRPAQEAYGMKVLGPLLDVEDPNVVIWLRSFPSPDERERMKREFYEGPEWTSSLEQVAMPMLDRYSVVVARTTPGALEGSLIHDR